MKQLRTRLVLALAAVASVIAAGAMASNAVSTDERASVPLLQFLAISGAPVDLAFRALQPGEVILAAVREDPSIKRVILRFMDQTRSLEFPAGQSGPFALFGIDVAAKPQVYVLEVKTERTDGSAESIRQDLVVSPKEFPRRQFRVAQNMLVPPDPEAERVRREAGLVAAVLAVVSPDWLATGDFASPLPDREPYPNFGQQRVYNKSYTSTHTGVDFAAPWGTPVKASNAGRVVLASRLYLSGYTVIIDHGLGVFTYYCHFSKLLVKRGDLVQKGQAIANAGNTGRSTGPHLHFSVRILDSRVDPFCLVAFPLNPPFD
jgi:murein DD-endopeptidase MepM/ murein hydrolase activator NlpD